MTCPLFCEFLIALILKELFAALCFLELLKNVNEFLVFFVQFVFEFRSYSSLSFYGVC